jgi:DNA invertase Pin-like site-specific DNA recombinase
MNFCNANKLSLVATFSEEGVSGTVEAMDREAFTELVCYIEARAKTDDKIEAVVVERMDRLARDLMVSEILLAELRKRGIKVFAADQGAVIDMANDEGDPTRKLVRQIIAALAEWEKAQIVLKLRLARERKRALFGKCEGGPSYGVTVTERSILGLVKMWRAEKFTFERIAQLLNDGGFRTRSGGLWSKSRVFGIFKTDNERKKK